MKARTAIFFTRQQLVDYLNYLDRQIAEKLSLREFDKTYDSYVAMRYQVIEALHSNF